MAVIYRKVPPIYISNRSGVVLSKCVLKVIRATVTSNFINTLVLIDH